MVSVEPDTLHTAGVVEAKLTCSPEDAVALRVSGAVPIATSLSAPKLIMVCGETVQLGAQLTETTAPAAITVPG